MSEVLSTPARSLTVEAAAAYLTMSKSYIRKRVYDGSLPAKRLGTRVIILVEDLDRMLERAPRA